LRAPVSSLRNWLAVLDQLEELKPIIIVPSHGPTGDGTGFIISYRTYLTDVRDRTAAQKRPGGSMDQAVETVTAAFGNRAPDKARLAGAIKAAYAEAPWVYSTWMADWVSTAERWEAADIRLKFLASTGTVFDELRRANWSMRRRCLAERISWLCCAA
jgi:hypothetical protein